MKRFAVGLCVGLLLLLVFRASLIWFSLALAGAAILISGAGFIVPAVKAYLEDRRKVPPA